MRILAAVMLLILFVGCDETLTIDFGGNTNVPEINHRVIVYPPFAEEYPTIRIEQVFREKNWLGPQKKGSCVHASMVMLFRWQEQYDLADRWRRTYSDGEWATNLAAKLDAEGVRYAYTSQKNDVSFLEWAVTTRRGCAVTVQGGAHMVILVHLDTERAGILDNNSPENIKWVPRGTFISEWKNSTSWAVTPVYSPPPPLPYSKR